MPRFNRTTFSLCLTATLLALVVASFGAYVRLSHAGLSCPDWPGCYGKVVVPSKSNAIKKANLEFPQRQVNVGKAWKEMIHRYMAGALGILILVISAAAYKRRDSDSLGFRLSIVLLALLVIQVALGMWTVTFLLKPFIVLSHLVGGMSIVALLFILTMRQFLPLIEMQQSYLITGVSRDYNWFGVKLLGKIAIAILCIQILLGGWMSTNYAALACTDFPTCNQTWVPDFDWEQAFTIWQNGLGANYEGGVLSPKARVTIHWAHRVGALITTMILLILATTMLAKSNNPYGRLAVWCMLISLAVQIGLGVANILLQLPLWVAVLHNVGAVIVLLSTILVYYLNFSVGSIHINGSDKLTLKYSV